MPGMGSHITKMHKNISNISRNKTNRIGESLKRYNVVYMATRSPIMRL